MHDLLTRNLGIVLLRTDGKGLYSKRVATIACEVVVQLDPDIEINNDGTTVDFANSYFEVRLKKGWHAPVDGHPYTDATFEKGVASFLVLHGLPGSVEWSERGRQEDDFADFDCGYDLLEAMFPDAFAKARADKLTDRRQNVPVSGDAPFRLDDGPLLDYTSLQCS
jgi:hypothetical protein